MNINKIGEYEAEAKTTFANVINSMPSVFAKQNESMIQDLTQENVLRNRLKIGSQIPDFELPNSFGKNISSKDLLDKKWLVISFYRGHWCPFCNIELRMLQKHLDSIEKTPARLVAISPQKPDISKELIAKHNLKFEVLYDKDMQLMKKFGIVYHLPEYLVETYKGFGLDEAYLDVQGKMQIPVPATYIVDQTGMIRFSFAEIDFVKRLDPIDLVNFIAKN